MTKKQRAGIIIERLREEYPDATDSELNSKINTL